MVYEFFAYRRTNIVLTFTFKNDTGPMPMAHEDMRELIYQGHNIVIDGRGGTGVYNISPIFNLGVTDGWTNRPIDVSPRIKKETRLNE